MSRASRELMTARGVSPSNSVGYGVKCLFVCFYIGAVTFLLASTVEQSFLERNPASA